MPKVSIVIPTRNRGHLLRYALYSALQQTYKDIEVVISDNCSTDNTREVVDLFSADARVRYIRADKPLALTDSWEFACSHANGKYLALLTDDCFYFKNAIKRAVTEMEGNNVKVGVWNTCPYYYPEWHERRKNTVYIPKWTNKCELLYSNNTLRNLFDLNIYYPYPKFLNSCIDMSVIQEIKNHQTRLLLPPYPDFSSAVSVLGNIDKYAFIDLPLAIDGITPISIGASQMFDKGESAKKILGDLENYDMALDIPVITTWVNIAQSIKKAAEFYPDIPYEVNKDFIICKSMTELIQIHLVGSKSAKLGADLDYKRLKDFINKQPGKLKKAVARHERLVKIKIIAKKIYEYLPYWEHIERIRTKSRYYVFSGRKYGFNNIKECGDFIENFIERKMIG